MASKDLLVSPLRSPPAIGWTGRKSTGCEAPLKCGVGELNEKHVCRPAIQLLVATNALVVALAAVFAGDTFLSLYNFQSMSAQVPELALLALGVMLAMIAGGAASICPGIALAQSCRGRLLSAGARLGFGR